MSTTPPTPATMEVVPLTARERRLGVAAAVVSGLVVIAAVVRHVAEAVAAGTVTVVAIAAFMAGSVALGLLAWLSRRAVLAAVPVDGVRTRPQAFDAFVTGELTGDPAVDDAAWRLAVPALRARHALLTIWPVIGLLLGTSWIVRGIADRQVNDLLSGALVSGFGIAEVRRTWLAVRRWDAHLADAAG